MKKGRFYLIPLDDVAAARKLLERLQTIRAALVELRDAVTEYLSRNGSISSLAAHCEINHVEVKRIVDGSRASTSERVIRPLAHIVGIPQVGTRLTTTAKGLHCRLLTLALLPERALEAMFAIVEDYTPWHARLSTEAYAAIFGNEAPVVRGALEVTPAAVAALGIATTRDAIVAMLTDPSHTAALEGAVEHERAARAARATHFAQLEVELLDTHATHEAVAKALGVSSSTTLSARQGNVGDQTYELLIAKATKLLGRATAHTTPPSSVTPSLPGATAPPPPPPQHATSDALGALQAMLPALYERYRSYDAVAEALGTSRSTLAGVRQGRSKPGTIGPILSKARTLLGAPNFVEISLSKRVEISAERARELHKELPYILAAAGANTEDNVRFGFDGEGERLSLPVELDDAFVVYIVNACEHMRIAANALGVVEPEERRLRLQKRLEREFEETFLSFKYALARYPGQLSELLRGQREIFMRAQRAVGVDRKK